MVVAIQWTDGNPGLEVHAPVGRLLLGLWDESKTYPIQKTSLPYLRDHTRQGAVAGPVTDMSKKQDVQSWLWCTKRYASCKRHPTRA